MYAMHCIIYISLYALYSMHCIICIVLYALYSMHCFFMHCILCIVCYSLFSMHFRPSDHPTDRPTDIVTYRAAIAAKNVQDSLPVFARVVFHMVNFKCIKTPVKSILSVHIMICYSKFHRECLVIMLVDR